MSTPHLFTTSTEAYQQLLARQHAVPLPPSTGKDTTDTFICALRAIGKELTCTICLSLMNDPVILPCAHLYCQGCVETLLQQSTKATEHNCPQCRSYVLKRAMKRDETVTRLVQIYRKLHPNANQQIQLTQVATFSQIAQDMAITPPLMDRSTSYIASDAPVTTTTTTTIETPPNTSNVGIATPPTVMIAQQSSTNPSTTHPPDSTSTAATTIVVLTATAPSTSPHPVSSTDSDASIPHALRARLTFSKESEPRPMEQSVVISPADMSIRALTFDGSHQHPLPMVTSPPAITSEAEGKLSSIVDPQPPPPPQPQPVKDPFRIGAMVTTVRRMGSGQNRPSAIARIRGINADSTVNIKYVLDQSAEQNVEKKYLIPGKQMDMVLGGGTGGNGESTGDKPQQRRSRTRKHPDIVAMESAPQQPSSSSSSANLSHPSSLPTAAPPPPANQTSSSSPPQHKRLRPIPSATLSISTTGIRKTDEIFKTITTALTVLPNAVLCAMKSDVTDSLWAPTHLIVPCNSDFIAQTRTFKYTQAIAMGIWILSPQWITSCINAKQWVDETLFEISTDCITHARNLQNGGPKRARLRVHENQMTGGNTPLLFHGLRFAIVNIANQDGDHHMDEYIILVHLCGGVLVDIHDAPNLLVVNSSRPQPLSGLFRTRDKAIKSQMPIVQNLIANNKCKMVRTEWITACVTAYTMVDANEFPALLL